MDMSPANRREGYSLNEEEKNMLLIRGGYINVLIADELLADKLLELAAE